MTGGLQVIFGTGPAGTAVARALVDRGERVRMVNRSGKPSLTEAETIGGDATDPVFTTVVTAGASHVYFCLNAPNYHRWPEEFPPLQRGVLGGAAANGARLVVLENLYMYGPSDVPLRESTPTDPPSRKGRTRLAMSDELLAAHRRGDVQVAIGRASDFIGPGVHGSALGELVFERAIAGRKAQVMGRPDTLHTYSYVPDVGRNLVLLVSRDDAYGRVWHLPNPETRTTREIVGDIYAELGRNGSKLVAARKPLLRAVGLFDRATRELVHTYYQFDAPFVVDDRVFRHALGGTTTGWDEIVTTTVAAYRSSTEKVTS